MSARGLRSVILLVEDDPDDVLCVERLMSRYFSAHKLQVVPDGDEAIKYLRGDDRYRDRSEFPFPQLVLLDIALPKVSGLEVLAWIRENPDLRGLVVLILTGSDSPEHLRRAYDLHANSFLKKHPLLALPQVSKGILEYWLNVNQFPTPPPS